MTEGREGQVRGRGVFWREDRVGDFDRGKGGVRLVVGEGEFDGGRG